MVIEEAVVPLESSGLAQLLRDPRESARTLVLDCRPFLSFCQAHVRDSRAVHWNGLLRRRSRGRSNNGGGNGGMGVVSLEWLVPDRALLGRLRKGELAHLVVLDEGGGGGGSSSAAASLRPDSLARVMLDALLAEERAGTCHVYLRRQPLHSVCGLLGLKSIDPWTLKFKAELVPRASPRAHQPRDLIAGWEVL